ncbi:UDP-N-acetylglucosamine--peptide N-acetylglucosaminyltransferase 110 kDa subunit [Hondaea fermentalgiana]|uniref:UDP-N-acetylglucosamine--peptide N-acetylglucosaminyltransferase 110 kDa subunit n=1 Tax=Hondaea fermentalgiana TaxID=2315210 RepID=A0A2R5GLK8_9STRA|nr:UDP-N-acetylglucosamine--peptide N-acetylglucosaminyltransferase 110 kDa subunit [Hondaea fermentalgiana]|eukprot:GBG28764.1 UDP-N-acetylglucosamine--peptide N-acetylglucosaminyltransferase 110 kDa subunit [Hondaea fermentalgiana]
MKRLVQASQDALAEKSFGASLKAESLLVKACQLDDSLMAGPARLAEVYEATGELAKFAEVRHRQMDLASAKGSDDKSIQFGLEAAHAYGRAKKYAASREIFLRAITWQIDAEAMIAALDVLLRIHHECFLEDLPLDELESLSLKYLEHVQHAPHGAMRETFFKPQTVAEVAAVKIAFSSKTSDLERFCTRVLEVTSDAMSCALATSLLMALSLEGHAKDSKDGEYLFNPRADAPLLEHLVRAATSEEEDAYGQKWRAWALAAKLFLSSSRLAEARACCDRALVQLRRARETFDQKQSVASQGTRTAKQQTKVISFSSVAAAAAEPAKGTPQSRKSDLEKQKSTLLAVLFRESPQLWEVRASLLLRTYVQGSKGRLYDARAAARAAQEGTRSLDEMQHTDNAQRLCFAERAERLRSRLAALQLEAASYAIPLEGTRLARACQSQLNDQDESPATKLATAAFQFFTEQTVPDLAPLTGSALTLPTEKRAAAALQAAAALAKNAQGEASVALKIACAPPGATPFSEAAEPLLARLDLAGKLPSLTPVLPWYLCLQGESLWRAGNATQAAKFLLKAAQLDPTWARTFFLLGKIYDEKGDNDRALKCFEKSLALEPAQSELVHLVAAALWAQKQVPAVMDLYKRVIAFVDDLAHKGSDTLQFRAAYTDAWVRLGRLELGGGKAEDAARSFQKAIAGDESRYDAWQGLGDAYARTGKREGALMALSEAVSRMSAAFVPADRQAYVYLRLGRLHLENGVHDQAIEALEKANQMYESQATSWTLARARLARAESLISDDRGEAAAEEIERGLLDIGENKSTSCTMAVHQLRARLYDLRASALPVNTGEAHVSAMRNHAKVLAAEPWRAATWRAMGECAVRAVQQATLNADDESRVDAQQPCRAGQRCAEVCVALVPTDTQAWTLLGTVHGLRAALTTHDTQATSKEASLLTQHCLVRAAQLDPAEATAAWCNLGLLFERSKRPEAALRAFTEAQAGRRREKAVSWAARARIALAQGDSVKKVLATMRCARDSVSPGSETTSDTEALIGYFDFTTRLAWTQLGRQGWADVEDVARRVLRRSPTHKLGHYCMGLALQARNAPTDRIAHHLRLAPLRMAYHHLVSLGVISLNAFPSDVREVTLASENELARAMLAGQAKEGGRAKVTALPKDLCQDDPILAFRANPTEEPIPHLPQACSEGDRYAMAALEALEPTKIDPSVVESAKLRAKLFAACKSTSEAIYSAPWEPVGWVTRGRLELGAQPAVQIGASKSPRLDRRPLVRCMQAARAVQPGSRKDLSFVLEAAASRLAGQPTRAYSSAAAAYYAAPYSRRAAQVLVGCVHSKEQASAALPVAKMLATSTQRSKLDLLRFVEVASMAGDSTAAVEAADIVKRELADGSDSDLGVVAELLAARAQRSPPAYLEALGKLPNAPLFWVELALLVSCADVDDVAADCFVKAVSDLEAASDESKESDGPTKVECFLRLAQAEFLASRFGVGRSLGGMNKAAKIFPGESRVHLVRGWLQLFQASDAKARKAALVSLRKALDANPNEKFARELVASVEDATSS